MCSLGGLTRYCCKTMVRWVELNLLVRKARGDRFSIPALGQPGCCAVSMSLSRRVSSTPASSSEAISSLEKA